MFLPDQLPASIARRCLQPPGLPPGEVAWSQDDALIGLAALDGSIVAVIQVDVYVAPFGQQELVFTGRRATYIYEIGERASEFAQRSRRAAAEFIRAGTTDELFVIHFSGQDDAESGRAMGGLKVG